MGGAWRDERQASAADICAARAAQTTGIALRLTSHQRSVRRGRVRGLRLGASLAGRGRCNRQRRAGGRAIGDGAGAQGGGQHRAERQRRGCRAAGRAAAATRWPRHRHIEEAPGHVGCGSIQRWA